MEPQTWIPHTANLRTHKSSCFLRVDLKRQKSTMRWVIVYGRTLCGSKTTRYPLLPDLRNIIFMPQSIFSMLHRFFLILFSHTGSFVFFCILSQPFSLKFFYESVLNVPHWKKILLFQDSLKRSRFIKFWDEELKFLECWASVFHLGCDVQNFQITIETIKASNYRNFNLSIENYAGKKFFYLKSKCCFKFIFILKNVDKWKSIVSVCAYEEN